MQRLFTYNIQTKVGSNLNRYTYVLNNPLKYTDPNDYAYYGYGGPNASAGVMQNRCLISQQIEDFETRRSAFLSNQWHDVTLFDMIGDRGGAVSGNYSTPAPVPISYVWVNDYSVDDEQTFTITAKKLFYTDYFKGAALNSFLNNDFTPYYQVAQGGGGTEPPLFKYAGDQSKYPGAIVVETSLMSGGAVTLPPFVFTAPGRGKNQDLMRHEHGHILQYVGLSILSGSPVTGYGLYLLGIGVPSIFSADKANNDPNHFHQGTYTEKSANQLEYWFQGMPANWNHTRYPVYWK